MMAKAVNVYIEATSTSTDELEVSLESLITLFVLKLSESTVISLKIARTNTTIQPKFTISTATLNFCDFELIEDLPELATLCQRPVLIKGSFLVSGLCSVARQIIKHSSIEEIRKLLGFREACLMACSESSIWTKFCEVDIISTVKNVFSVCYSSNDDFCTLPSDIKRFDNHLNQPVKTHNIYKIARVRNKDNSIKSGACLKELQMDHIFAEGVYATLSDVILLIPYKILFDIFGDGLKQLESTVNWFSTVSKIYSLLEFEFCKPSFLINDAKRMKFDEDVPNVSLYTSDPKRYKPQKRIFTKDADVERAMANVDALKLNVSNENCLFGDDVPFDWSKIPLEANPEGGALPAKRANRKCDQLSSLAKPVVKIVGDNSIRIVDFCSGSGHLGILIAYLLPKCEVILVENKERSLDRACETIKKIGLTNVRVIQCNLDYFIGRFDLGTCLHACGVATDLVIQTCITKRAHFVACPCCYGSIHDCYHLKYPRSEEMSVLNQKEYLNLAHAADQTHKDNAKTVQGYKCMDIIDYDRKLQAESNNYDVHLGKLQPEDCTPKNNLLVGILRR